MLQIGAPTEMLMNAQLLYIHGSHCSTHAYMAVMVTSLSIGMLYYNMSENVWDSLLFVTVWSKVLPCSTQKLSQSTCLRLTIPLRQLPWPKPCKDSPQLILQLHLAESKPSIQVMPRILIRSSYIQYVTDRSTDRNADECPAPIHTWLSLLYSCIHGCHGNKPLNRHAVLQYVRECLR